MCMAFRSGARNTEATRGLIFLGAGGWDMGHHNHDGNIRANHSDAGTILWFIRSPRIHWLCFCEMTIVKQLERRDSQIDLKYVILLMEEIRLTSWYGRYPIFHMFFYIPGGAMLLPSTLPYTIGEEVFRQTLSTPKTLLGGYLELMQENPRWFLVSCKYIRMFECIFLV